jgi:hypothetical protein
MSLIPQFIPFLRKLITIFTFVRLTKEDSKRISK